MTWLISIAIVFGFYVALVATLFFTVALLRAFFCKPWLRVRMTRRQVRMLAFHRVLF